MNTLNINVNLNNDNEKKFITDLITSMINNQNINISLNFTNGNIKESSTDKEKLYELVLEKLATIKESTIELFKIKKPSKEELFKLLDLIDNSLDDSLTGVEQIECQCNYLRNAFDRMPLSEIDSILTTKGSLFRIIFDEDKYLIHKDRGGIVDGSFDDFDFDFVNWMGTRGTKFLLNYLMNNGPYFIMGYIHYNKISEEEYFNDGAISQLFYEIEEKIEVATNNSEHKCEHGELGIL